MDAGYCITAAGLQTSATSSRKFAAHTLNAQATSANAGNKLVKLVQSCTGLLCVTIALELHQMLLSVCKFHAPINALMIYYDYCYHKCMLCLNLARHYCTSDFCLCRLLLARGGRRRKLDWVGRLGFWCHCHIAGGHSPKSFDMLSTLCTICNG